MPYRIWVDAYRGSPIATQTVITPRTASMSRCSCCRQCDRVAVRLGDSSPLRSCRTFAGGSPGSNRNSGNRVLAAPGIRRLRSGSVAGSRCARVVRHQLPHAACIFSAWRSSACGRLRATFCRIVATCLSAASAPPAPAAASKMFVNILHTALNMFTSKHHGSR